MKVTLKWEASFNHDTCYEYLNLLVSSTLGHDLVYRCVKNDSGSLIAGIDLSDPMVVVPALLEDLGIKVSEVHGLPN